MFTDAQKTDIRRFCGYGVYGAIATQGFGYRFFTWAGTLEYRLNNLSAAEEAVVINTFLTNLYQLETDVPAVRDNLDTDQAAVWYHNKRELNDRYQLLNSWAKRLCGFLGIPPGQFLSPGGIRRVI
jgi:hypothetical protein